MVCPMSPYDLRYSISSEDPAARSASSRPRSEREKDRLSYSFSHLSVDITAVTFSVSFFPLLSSLLSVASMTLGFLCLRV